MRKFVPADILTLIISLDSTTAFSFEYIFINFVIYYYDMNIDMNYIVALGNILVKDNDIVEVAIQMMK